MIRRALAPSLLALLGAALGHSDESRDAVARSVLTQAGLRGGLIVHVGCGDGTLTAALGADEARVVHGLDTDAGNVQRARAHIESLGLYGRVSVERWAGDRLPCADNLVNLLVWTDSRAAPGPEAMRVLAPGGVAIVRQGAEWRTRRKAAPAETDEWTHYLHDASGNPVAHDQLIAPPGSLQWTADPPHMRSHEHIPGLYGLISQGGRLFYILDQGPIASVRELSRWSLVARDAYNGLPLWERPIDKWYPHVTIWSQAPAQLHRRLVAAEGRLYATLGLYLAVAALDAATGETVRTYPGTEGAEEIVYHRGTLLVAARRVTAERVAERDRLEQLAGEAGSPLYVRDTAQPLIDNFRRTDAQAEPALLALDATTGELLWKKEGAEAAGLRGLSLCAEGDRVLFQRGGNVVCLSLTTGTELWTQPAPPLRLVAEGRVVCLNGQTVTVFSAETGAVLWTGANTLTEARDAFMIGGALWLGGGRPWEPPKPTQHSGPAWGPYFAVKRNPDTGEILQEIAPENPGHHHRCYSNKATDRYILGGRRGTEFIDLASGEVLWNSWARGVCRYGVMPSYGLLYVPPHACGCYIAAKLMGFNAMAPARPAPAGETPVVERGPAFETTTSGAPAAADWPMYRHDAQRSGATPALVPTALRVLWESEVGGKLTAPVVADGQVLFGAVDRHSVVSLDADSGRPAWRFTAGGRIDSAPTLHGGRVLFGCRDGFVYSLRAADGALGWRSRLAREDRRIVACGQIESVAPALGSVLVRDGAAYCVSGRSSYLDGGISLTRLDLATGQPLSRTPIFSPDPETGKQPPHLAPGIMPGARADLLSADDGHVYLRDLVFDPAGAPLVAGAPHLLTLTDYLDDSWPHRSYWIFGTKPSIATGCTGRDRNLTYGRLLAFTDSAVYGYGRKTLHWSNQLEDGPYRLFAVKRDEASTVLWERPVPLHVRAMVLAGETLFVAGPRTE
ncbi:MAG: methyltransferase domain-containing protein, partial [Armatimonadetes bacterium]|nr:methyltransferase domain-containing protein [Armatimonadota bacterium]